VRRFFAFGLAWLVAAVVATVVAWQGVGLIGHQVTGHRPATLSAGQIDKALDTTTDHPLTPSSAPSTTAAPGAGTTPPPGTGTNGTVATGTTAPTAGGGGGGSGSGSTLGGSGTTAAPAVAPVTRTYRLDGGTTTIRFSPTAVTVLVSTPNSGYQYSTGSGDNGGVRVEFTSDTARSRIDAWWAGGPQTKVDESTSGGGGGGGGHGSDG
jgi:hypothetical protein